MHMCNVCRLQSTNSLCSYQITVDNIQAWARRAHEHSIIQNWSPSKHTLCNIYSRNLYHQT